MKIEELDTKSIEDWTDEELKAAAQTALPKGLSPEGIQDLFWLRLCGLSALQCSKKPLRKVTLEDFEWWTNEKEKKSLYDPKMDGKILTAAGREESIQYFKDCDRKERKELEDYIQTHIKFLATNYPIYITSWFSTWGDFHREYDVEPNVLDWSIFFSLLSPRPPWTPHAKIPLIFEKFFTMQRQTNKPVLIKYIWDTPELRTKVLAGEPIPYQWEVIVPYSTIYSSIKRFQEVEDKRKEAGRDMERGRNHRMKELLPLFKQVDQAEKEGNEVVLIPLPSKRSRLCG